MMRKSQNDLAKPSNEMVKSVDRKIQKHTTVSGYSALNNTKEKEPSRITLTRNQLAEKLQISKVTIWNLMKSGKLPYHRIGAKKLLFFLDEVLAAFPKIQNRVSNA
jgi:excisionase family DNA binding protein